MHQQADISSRTPKPCSQKAQDLGPPMDRLAQPEDLIYLWEAASTLGHLYTQLAYQQVDTNPGTTVSVTSSAKTQSTHQQGSTSPRTIWTLAPPISRLTLALGHPKLHSQPYQKPIPLNNRPTLALGSLAPQPHDLALQTSGPALAPREPWGIATSHLVKKNHAYQQAIPSTRSSWATELVMPEFGPIHKWPAAYTRQPTGWMGPAMYICMQT